MARFTVRVELHRHQPRDYDVLHAQMQAQGFDRTINDDKGNTLQLPTAEYVGEIENVQEILRMARAAATQVGRSYEVLVTQTDRRTWYKLTPV
jgi:hypothetical protein